MLILPLALPPRLPLIFCMYLLIKRLMDEEEEIDEEKEFRDRAPEVRAIMR